MNQQKFEVKCPNCDNCIPLDEANFCGACGVDVSYLKQQQYQSNHILQEQYYAQMRFQQHQQQMQLQHQQMQLQYAFKPKKRSFFLSLVKFLLIFGIISCISILGIMYIANMYFSSSLDGGIDESLFYNYFIPDNSSVDPDEYFFAGGISKTEYNKLEIGMSYALASFIIGGDGDLVNTGENLQKKTYYTYRWFSEIDVNLIYFITFVDDEINEITLDYDL